jgi:hypothetical protein
MTEKDQTNHTAPRRAAPAKRPHFWHTLRTCLFTKKKREDVPDWHTLLAFSMVIIATAGAIVAGGTAVAEQEANRLERLLTWGHRIAIAEQQQWLADAATRRELELRVTAYRRLSREYLKAGRQQGVQGSCLRQQGLEELAAARALEPVLKALPNLPDAQNPGLRDRLARPSGG